MRSIEELRDKHDISEDDLKIYQKLFLEYDSDRNGFISKVEARNCLDRLSLLLDKSDFKAIFNAAAMKSNQLDLKGFIEFVSKARNLIAERNPKNSSNRASRMSMVQFVKELVIPAVSEPNLHSQAISEQTRRSIAGPLTEIKIEHFEDYKMFDPHEDLDEVELSQEMNPVSISVRVLESPVLDAGDSIVKPLSKIENTSNSSLPKKRTLAVATQEAEQLVDEEPSPEALEKGITEKPKEKQAFTARQKTGKKEKGPTKRQMNALMNPQVRKQLMSQKPHRPFFMIFMAIVLVAMIIVEIVYNGGIESFSLNPMGGPSAVTLVRLGGKYVPCMKRNSTIIDTDLIPCFEGYNGTKTEGKCTYYTNTQFLCGMNGFKTVNLPDQWWRFITPIFLHVGIIHLVLNMTMLLKTGIALERVIGTIRIAILYVLSGIGGNLFSAVMAPKIVSVGASSSLYGFYGLLLLDLIQNWPLLSTPYRDLLFLSVNIIISLGVGLLPFIDNYAHIGGFVTGLLSGIVFMPRIFFSKWDKRRKLILAAICLPLVIAGFVYGFIMFYSSSTGQQLCPWCVYLDCVPPNSDWCKNEQP